MYFVLKFWNIIIFYVLCSYCFLFYLSNYEYMFVGFQYVIQLIKPKSVKKFNHILINIVQSFFK